MSDEVIIPSRRYDQGHVFALLLIVLSAAPLWWAWDTYDRFGIIENGPSVAEPAAFGLLMLFVGAVVWRAAPLAVATVTLAEDGITLSQTKGAPRRLSHHFTCDEIDHILEQDGYRHDLFGCVTKSQPSKEILIRGDALVCLAKSWCKPSPVLQRTQALNCVGWIRALWQGERIGILRQSEPK